MWLRESLCGISTMRSWEYFSQYVTAFVGWCCPKPFLTPAALPQQSLPPQPLPQQEHVILLSITKILKSVCVCVCTYLQQTKKYEKVHTLVIKNQSDLMEDYAKSKASLCLVDIRLLS